MNWQFLTSIENLDFIDVQSKVKPQLIFKHSTRCSISVTAKNRLDKIKDSEEIDCYFLDLLQHREISNKIAEHYKVHHESPQVLLIKNGEAVYVETHLGIEWDDIIEQLEVI